MKLTLKVRAQAEFDMRTLARLDKPTQAVEPPPSTGAVGSVQYKFLHLLRPAAQEMANWCWAASSQMITEYLRGEGQSGFSQCALATKVTNEARAERNLPPIDCCSPDLSAEERAECDQGSWPFFAEFNDRAQSTLQGGGDDYALSWLALTRLIDRECPVAFARRWPSGSGHMMVASGYVVTPPDKKWVTVVNPLPPGNGDWYLIPYEHYVSGMDYRHWRDYWLPLPPPGPEREQHKGHPLAGLSWSQCRVRSVPPQWPREKPRKTADGKTPPDEELKAARRAAEAALDALKAIATEAPSIAMSMGMGGNFFQLFAKPLLPALAGIASEAGEDSSPAMGLATAILPALQLSKKNATELGANVNPEELTLDPKPLPEYNLSRKDLRKWDGINPEDLLKEPKQLHWNVLRKELEPFSFFATITVRRTRNNGWRVISLGRLALMQTQGLAQLFSKNIWKERTVEELLSLLSKLNLVEPFWTLLTELPDMVELETPGTLVGLVQFRNGWNEWKRQLGQGDKDIDRLSGWLEGLMPQNNVVPDNLEELVRKGDQGSQWELVVAATKEMADNVDKWLEATRKKDPAGRGKDAKTLARVLDRWLLSTGPERVATAKRAAVEEVREVSTKLKTMPNMPETLKRALADADVAAKAADAAVKKLTPYLEEMAAGAELDEGTAAHVESAREDARETAKKALLATANAVEAAADVVGRDAIEHARAAQRHDTGHIVFRALETNQFLKGEKKEPMLEAARKKREQAYASVDKAEAKVKAKLETGEKLETKLETAKTVLAAAKASERAAGSAEDAAHEVRMLAKRAGKEPSPVPPTERPDAAISVRGLYQLFLAYGEEDVVPVYPRTFYAPGRCIEKGSKLQVLRALKEQAEELSLREVP